MPKKQQEEVEDPNPRSAEANEKKKKEKDGVKNRKPEQTAPLKSTSTKGSKNEKPKDNADEADKWSTRDKIIFTLLVALGLIWIWLFGPLIFSSRFFTHFFTPTYLLPLKYPLALSSPNLASKDHLAKYFWGTYRPQVYFGIRARNPKSVIAGFMWLNKENSNALRHTCEQGDKLDKYGWNFHNGLDYASEQIIDGDLNLATDFVKQSGGNYGGDWAARVSASFTGPSKKNKRTSLIFYIADETENPLKFKKTESKIIIEGANYDFGQFEVHFEWSEMPEEAQAPEILYIGAQTSHFHNITEFVSGNLKSRSQSNAGKRIFPNIVQEYSTLIAVQFLVETPFNFHVSYRSLSGSQDRYANFAGEQLTRIFESKKREYDERFNSLFHLSEKGYNNTYIDFAKHALSNLIGGIGYFHGKSIVRAGGEPKPRLYWESALYTAVPSRSFFPRGFLWDEGFHELMINIWDSSITMDVIAHWLDLMNREGWIPREQILGEEAKRKVPPEFIIQNTEYANPPTLLFPIQQIVSKAQEKLNNKAKENEELAFFKNRLSALKGLVWLV